MGETYRRIVIMGAHAEHEIPLRGWIANSIWQCGKQSVEQAFEHVVSLADAASLIMRDYKQEADVLGDENLLPYIEHWTDAFCKLASVRNAFPDEPLLSSYATLDVFVSAWCAKASVNLQAFLDCWANSVTFVKGAR